MKQIMAMIMTVCVILGTVTGCGEKSKGGISILELAKNVSAVQNENYAISEFTSVEQDDVHSLHSEIRQIDGEKSTGEIIITEVDNKFEGVVVRSYFTSLGASKYAMQLVKDLGISPKSCTTIENKIIDSAYLNVINMLDTDGYRITGATIMVENTHIMEFVFFIQLDTAVEDYKEGSFHSSNL